MTPEGKIKAYLVSQVKALGGEVRFAQWVGRVGCPDCYVMLPHRPPVWVECKAEDGTFPATAHERRQEAEHDIMWKYSAYVYICGSKESVDLLLHET